jgi:hypothetical protein
MSAFLEAILSECSDKEGSSILSKTMDLTIENVLSNAKKNAQRRNSSTIREKDIRDAIKLFQSLQPSVPRFYRIPVAGKGACLFISMRLVLEMAYIESQIDLNDPPKCFLLDGEHAALEAAAQSLRLKCVDWYARKYDAEVPQLGKYVENGRLYVRGDLPALEMVRKGMDVPESGQERFNLIKDYLQNMSHSTTWGSSPEYTAVGLMTRKRINIWQNNDAFKIIDSVNGTLEIESEDDISE